MSVPASNLPFTPLCVLEGVVTHGKQLGRTIGFPTLNLQADGGTASPHNGVYAALCWLLPSQGDACPQPTGTEKTQAGAPCDSTRPYLAVLNQGTHPTFPEGPPTVEAHLLDFDGDAYGWRARLCYGCFLRPEMRFSGGASLAAQLCRDCENARRWAAALPDVPLARSSGKGAGKGASKQPGRDAGKGASKQLGRSAGKDESKQPGRDAGKDASKQSGKGAGKDASKQSGKGAGKDESNVEYKPPSKYAGKK